MKAVLRISGWVFGSILFMVLMIAVCIGLDNDYQTQSMILSDAEKKAPIPSLVSRDYSDEQIDQLRAEFGRHKVIPKEFELPCLLALSYYPQLREVPMHFVVRPAFLPLASRPDPWSTLLPWRERTYLVIISNESTDFFDPILLHRTPFNEQVGIVGHELAHTVFYLDKSAWRIAQIGLKYQRSNFYRIQFERETDKRAIAHGLGYQLYDLAFFIRKAFGHTKERILNEAGDMYLSPMEIAEDMRRYQFYEHALPDPDSYF